MWLVAKLEKDLEQLAGMVTCSSCPRNNPFLVPSHILIQYTRQSRSDASYIICLHILTDVSESLLHTAHLLLRFWRDVYQCIRSARLVKPKFCTRMRERAVSQVSRVEGPRVSDFGLVNNSTTAAAARRKSTCSVFLLCGEGALIGR